MTYKRYGVVFKTLRKQKHLPLSYFESFGIEKTTIQRFETGKTMMGFEKLDCALQAMNVTLGEYEHFLNFFQPDYLEEVVNEVIGNIYLENNVRLQMIAQDCAENDQLILSLATRSCYEKLNEEDIEKIVSYLYDIRQWGYFELSIFYIVMKQFSEREIMHLMRDFWDKGKDFYGIFKYRRRFLETSYKAILILSLRGCKDSVNTIIKESYFTDKVYDIYCENLRRLSVGVYKQMFFNSRAGYIEWQSACNLFKDFGHDELYDYYRKSLRVLDETE